ncbi:MAG: hypothetical protein WA417_04495 [Stellaceae bacterium]
MQLTGPMPQQLRGKITAMHADLDGLPDEPMSTQSKSGQLSIKDFADLLAYRFLLDELFKPRRDGCIHNFPDPGIKAAPWIPALRKNLLRRSTPNIPAIATIPLTSDAASRGGFGAIRLHPSLKPV